MVWIIALCVFMIGAVLGSFVNVVISRMIVGEDWIRGRSRCDHCRKVIAWYDNVPLLSYLLLGGKCRHCKKTISIQHPTVELMTGMLFAWWYVIGFAFFQLSQHPLQVIQPLFWLFVGILLLVIFVTDWLYMIIPDFAVVGLGLVALMYRVYLTQAGVMRIDDLWWAVVSGIVAALFFFGLWAGTKGRGMGFGDVKYALVMGWLLGWPRVLVGVFAAFCIGAIVGVVMIVWGKKKMKQQIAFGPFLVIGTLLALVWGNHIWSWYMGFMH
jgi:leader peptidase (prepilin peptidase)/N-methyltransferase